MGRGRRKGDFLTGSLGIAAAVACTVILPTHGALFPGGSLHTLNRSNYHARQWSMKTRPCGIHHFQGSFNT
jgi:hypothetical protein